MKELLLEIFGWLGYLERPAVLLQLGLVIAVGLLFLSLVSIVIFMLMGFSPELSVFWATVVAFVTSFLHRDCAMFSYEFLRGREPFVRGFFDSPFFKALDGGARAVGGRRQQGGKSAYVGGTSRLPAAAGDSRA